MGVHVTQFAAVTGTTSLTVESMPEVLLRYPGKRALLQVLLVVQVCVGLVATYLGI